ncbi:MAG: OmpA family protein [Notoacmeibacter sp.]|nr:OmpA family protein [Notoacmeibacter sp.]
MARLTTLAALACMVTAPAAAQSTITLEDFDLGKKKPAAAQPAPETSPSRAPSSEMEKCLLDQANCTSKEFKTKTNFSLDDVVNLGVIDHEEAKKAKEAQAKDNTAAGKPADTAQALPSIDIEILFDYDSADVRPDQYAKLIELANVLKGAKFQDYRFAFLGHTDAKGSPDYNDNLSARRARAVSNFIQASAGLPSGQMIATGLGARKLKDFSDPYGPQNRRVQILLVKVK